MMGKPPPGFRHVMSDQNRREAIRQPNLLDEALHLDARQRIECAERLIERQMRGALTRATRCFWPPDKVDGHSPARSANPTVARASRDRCKAFVWSAAGPRPMATFASTRAQGRRRGS